MKVGLMKLLATLGASLTTVDPTLGPATLLREAPISFMENKVKKSVAEFERALEMDPSVRERLWQYGISLYADSRFVDCAAQFEFDYKKNPDDTEEVVWAKLCSRRAGVDEGSARQAMPRKRQDPRPVMRIVEAAYRDGDTSQLENIIEKYEEGSKSRDLAQRSVQEEADYFYSLLYLGLYEESNGAMPTSNSNLKKAASSLYGQKATRDYMTSVAKVLLLR